MTDSGASSGSTAKFGDSDSLERVMALPTVEELESGETRLGTLVILGSRTGKRGVGTFGGCGEQFRLGVVRLLRCDNEGHVEGSIISVAFNFWRAPTTDEGPCTTAGKR